MKLVVVAQLHFTRNKQNITEIEVMCWSRYAGPTRTIRAKVSATGRQLLAAGLGRPASAGPGPGRVAVVTQSFQEIYVNKIPGCLDKSQIAWEERWKMRYV